MAMSTFSLRVRGWLALGSFLAGFGLPFLSGAHLAADDDSCDQDSLIITHGPVLQFEGATPVTPLTHCALCHLQRSVRGARTSVATNVAWIVQPSETRVAYDAARHVVALLDPRSSRGPPVPLSS